MCSAVVLWLCRLPTHATRVPGTQETCLFNEICTNGRDLFSLKPGDTFECDFSLEGFQELQKILLSPFHEPANLEPCWESKSCIELDGPGQATTCDQCWRANDGGGDCSALPGCDRDMCSFCTNEPSASNVVG